MRSVNPYLLIFLTTLAMCLPFLVFPSILLDRGNDLQEFFWPIINYTKFNLLMNGSLPLWYTRILSGTPLLADPQAMLFYLPNIIFLLLPMGLAFIISIVLHLAVGGIGACKFAMESLKLKKESAVFAGLLYVTAPRLAGYIEAGHFGLITSWAWIPWVLLLTVWTATRPTVGHSLLLGISMALVFYSHTVAFVLVAFLSAATWIVVMGIAKFSRQSLFYYSLAAAVSFGLVAIVLIPQLHWSGQTNRFLLLEKPEVYPIWMGKRDFLFSVFVPWAKGLGVLQNITSEKWLTSGLLVTAMASIGLIKLPNKIRFMVSLAFLMVLLISLNNVSPVHELLLGQNWYKLMRVASRVWIIVAIGFIFLSAWAFDVVLRKHGKLNTFLNIFIFAAILESVALSWAYMAKAPPERAFVSPQILAYLAEDDGQGRVFCPSLCISQRGAQDYNLELVQGYSTLTQSNYMSAMVGYTNFFWDYYSLATPPFGAHRAVEFVPNIELLGENNVRYLVLTSRVEIDGLVAVAEDEGYYVYENEFYRPRASADIEYYSPNKLTLNTSAFLGSEGLLVRDTYSPGWVAHDSEGRVLSVQETPEHHRSVGLIDKTESVTMEYAPPGYGQGKRITAFTVLALATYGLIKWRRLL